MPDDRLELAYDAASKALSQQDTTLGNIRTRANALLSVAALVTSFSAGVGLFTNDPTKGDVLPEPVVWALFATLVGVGFCVMKVAWPVQSWAYGADSGVILEQAQQGKDIDQIRRYVAEKMTQGRNRNGAEILRRVTYYRFAVGFLVLQVALLLLGVALPEDPPEAQLVEPVIIRLQD